MGQTGIGVMLGILGGNEETVNSIKSSLGKIIKEASLSDDKLNILFEDGTRLLVSDDGQSCCEHRYMVTADTLSEYSGAKVLDFELKDGPDVEDEYGEAHEVKFLDVKTDKGVFQIANHNEHNGYYGGFWICAKIEN